jgi:hypothetical protein
MNFLGSALVIAAGSRRYADDVNRCGCAQAAQIAALIFPLGIASGDVPLRAPLIHAARFAGAAGASTIR